MMDTIDETSRATLLKQEIEKRRSRVTLLEHEIENSSSTDFPDNYPGYDDAWNFEKFKAQFQIQIIRLEDMEMEFDIIGLDVAIVNSFRRILISEVPTMAIEKVFMNNNTTIIQDEVLVHRLAMVPIKADPRLFAYRQPGVEEATAEDTIEFLFQSKCTQRSVKGLPVYSEQFKWIPIGTQVEFYKEDIRPVHEDILIAKVKYGHEIDLKVHCVKGIGKTHTKFSPVATASYRLLPEITLLREVAGEQAERLVKCFSPGVIEIVEKKDKTKVARVKNARKDTCSRNVLRHDDLKDCVEMTRVRNHVIFSIESTGALTPDILVVEAIKVLMNKCQTFLDELAANE